ncbi:hypothetical protein COCNU_scaffold010353G000010 [Cocos nucifera]|nr:hypothetical protein [Cocos nucifera]
MVEECMLVKFGGDTFHSSTVIEERALTKFNGDAFRSSTVVEEHTLAKLDGDTFHSSTVVEKHILAKFGGDAFRTSIVIEERALVKLIGDAFHSSTVVEEHVLAKLDKDAFRFSTVVEEYALVKFGKDAFCSSTMAKERVLAKFDGDAFRSSVVAEGCILAKFSGDAFRSSIIAKKRVLAKFGKNAFHSSTTVEECRLTKFGGDAFCSSIMVEEPLAEPCFFSTVLFLLRVTNQPKSSSSATPAAFAAAIATAIPFLSLHALFLYLPADFLRRVGIPADLLGPPSFAYRVRLSAASAIEARCTYPLFGAVLLAALGAVYVPLFVSACWGAVSVVINKRLRVRLYALAAVVVVALCVQVATLALSTLWDPGKVTSEGLKLASFVAVSCCAAAGEVILVVQPVLEALAIVDPEPLGTDGKDEVMGIDAAGLGDG